MEQFEPRTPRPAINKFFQSTTKSSINDPNKAKQLSKKFPTEELDLKPTKHGPPNYSIYTFITAVVLLINFLIIIGMVNDELWSISRHHKQMRILLNTKNSHPKLSE